LYKYPPFDQELVKAFITKKTRFLSFSINQK
jgi:hypothetical protein